jgi:hypothetical protein
MKCSKCNKKQILFDDICEQCYNNFKVVVVGMTVKAIEEQGLSEKKRLELLGRINFENVYKGIKNMNEEEMYECIRLKVHNQNLWDGFSEAIYNYIKSEKDN